MPGEGLTHGPPAAKNAGGSHHRFSRHPAFPAQWFDGVLRALPGEPGFLATITCAIREYHRKLDTSVGVSGPHGLAVRIDTSRLAQKAPGTAAATAPRLTFVTIAKRPS
jgi:hypothetical protein